MARCPECDEVLPIGSNCEIEDTDCIGHDGDGSGDDPFILVPTLSGDSDQLLECGADGLGAFLPDWLTDPPTCQVYATGPQTIATNTLVALTFNIERWDNDTMHSITVNTSRITFTTAGKYLVTFNGAWSALEGATGTTSYRQLILIKNGTDRLAMDTRRSVNDGYGVAAGQNLIVQEDFSANDYVEVFARHTVGASHTYESASFSPVFTAYRWSA